MRSLSQKVSKYAEAFLNYEPILWKGDKTIGELLVPSAILLFAAGIAFIMHKDEPCWKYLANFAVILLAVFFIPEFVLMTIVFPFLFSRWLYQNLRRKVQVVWQRSR